MKTLTRKGGKVYGALVAMLLTLGLIGSAIGATTVAKPKQSSFFSMLGTAVPDLYGLERDDAEARLKQFNLGFTLDNPSDEFAHCVIAQNPAPGQRVKAGTVVHVTLTQACPPPPKQVSVPRVIGDGAARARQRVEAAHLQLAVGGEQPSSSSQGSVISQDPGAGALVNVGSTVTVTLAAGGNQPPPATHPPATTTVPNVLGLSIEQAKSRLKASHLRTAAMPARIESDAAAGTIILEQPVAGSTVPLGSKVLLTAAKARALVTVPSLAGHTTQEATATLEAINLRLGAVETTHQIGHGVVDQKPSAGAQVPPRSVVAIVLAAGPVIIREVPNLKGLTLSQARARLRDHQLFLGSIKPIGVDTAAARIHRQFPRAGAKVGRSTAVDVTMSIQARANYTAHLWTSAEETDAGDSIGFLIGVSPPPSGAVYELDYGDGEVAAWHGDPASRHTYRKSGSHQALGRVRLADGRLLSTEVRLIKVRPNLSGWLIVLLAGAAGAGGWAALKLRPTLPKIHPPPIVTPPAVISFLPQVGHLRVGSASGLHAPRWAVRINTPGPIAASSLQPPNLSPARLVAPHA